MSNRLNRITRTTLTVSLMAAFAGALGAQQAVAAQPTVEEKLEIMQQEIETLKSQAAKSSGPGDKHGMAGSTTIGGYGEMHLNKLKNKKPGGTNKDELDFHRFILFVGHEFNDRVRFFSETEFEYAVTGGKNGLGKDNPGKVELEQAYLDFTLNDTLSAKAGLFLVPVGIINETHEPPTFYGVERNPVENKIIPATWWEGGAGITARLGDGFTLDGAITSGLKTALKKSATVSCTTASPPCTSTAAASNYAVRDGRQFVAQAVAKDPAYTARLKWAGMPGVELAGSVQYQADITQSTDATAGSAMLYEAHAVVSKGPVGLKALYAQWNLDGSGPKAVGADQQNGWYVEPAWKISEQWGVFARQSRWDNQAGDAADSKYSQADVGVNYWPHPDVVVKLDFQNQKSPTGKDEFDGFNVGVGYQF